ncbi:beta-lactamase family protein (plasmid) [Pedobacter sp. BS3]|uniref:serine hydrolase domain-containing protein n=1 Tax=Pedobacter sp. BS3 TaxID=2567937 RepID=UPI0011ED0F26|nr:serine hydrolase domain-containing protein [Pedobacter sp. BS3]TZF86396.1 beta-lactamase family protein [Pedobacter sp. BS3]
MKKTTLTILITGVLCQIGIAQNFDKIKLDNYFNALKANDKFMGSVAVSRDGKLIYSKSIGFADIENNILADANTKYRIGSISKTFTSVLVLKAVEGKKLDLSQTIDQYFPAIKNAAKITIKDLLSHRSGIPNFTNEKDYLTWHTQPKTEAEMVAIIAKAGSDFEPGSKAEYSNSNFVLLTYILEKSFKKSYTELLKEYITQPIGLVNTYLGGKIKTSEKESKSYKYTDTWKVEPETDISIPLGAGGIVSTPGDLVKFSDALFGGKLLKKESLETMKTIKDHYGIGLFQIPFYNKTGYGHTGGIDGFSAVFAHFSDGNISYALTSNGTNFNNNNISIAVLSAVYDKPYDIPEFSTYKVSSADLDKYLGVYSSTQIPLKITITKKNSTLIAQGTGQPSFPLEAIEKDKFKFDQAGVVLEFNPAAKTMTLKQRGGQFAFTKE